MRLLNYFGRVINIHWLTESATVHVRSIVKNVFAYTYKFDDETDFIMIVPYPALVWGLTIAFLMNNCE